MFSRMPILTVKVKMFYIKSLTIYIAIDMANWTLIDRRPQF